MKRLTFIKVIILIVASTIIISSAYNHSLIKTVNKPTRLSFAADCYLFQHFLGKTCIPQKPQSVVTLHLATLGNLLTLETKPVGSTTGDIKRDFPKHLVNKIDGIESVGYSTQPNLEKILKLKPDLIIYLSSNKSLYPLLSKIAPTVQDSWPGPVHWKEHLNFVARVLGKEDVYQKAWDRYYRIIQELKVTLGNRYRNKKFSFVYLAHNNHAMFVSELKNVFAGSILNDIGLQRTDVQDVVTPDGYIFIPAEELWKIDGDFIFIGISGDNDKKSLERLQKMRLWKTLEGVKQNHVYFVDLSTWREANLLAADAVIDDLYKYLVNTP